MSPDDSLSDSELEPVAESRSPARRRAQHVARVVFAVLVVGFGAVYIGSHWGALSEVARSTEPGYVVAAFGFALAGQVAAMLGFAPLLEAEAEDPIPKVETARAFYLTQLGKYIPGSIWAVVAMAGEMGRFGLRKLAGVRALVLSLAISTGLGLVLGGSLVLFAVLRPALWWIPVLGIASIVLAVARPELALNLCRPLLGGILPAHLSRQTLRRALLWPLVTWLMFGLQCWLLVVALGGPGLDSLAPAVGAFALAYAVGVIVVIAPSGLGVRETVLAVVLAATLGGAFDHDRAVVLVLASRALLAIVDFALAAAIIPIAHRARRVASHA